MADCGFKVSLLLTALCAAGTAPAFAGTVFSSPFMVVGEEADAPAGFIDMCKRDAVLCLAGQRTEPPAPVVAAPAALVASIDSASTMPRSRMLFASAPCSAVWMSSVYDDGEWPFARKVSLRFGPNAMDCEVAAPEALSSASPVPAIIEPMTAQAPVVEERALSASERRRADAGEMKMLKRINGHINMRIRQVPDMYTAGVPERWERPLGGRYGDCEDLAIEKRIQLLEAGYDPAKLFFAVAFKRGIGLHTVLVARTGQGDMVLDSLSAHVLPWAKVRYSWLRVQSAHNPMVWRRPGQEEPTTLVDGQRRLAASLVRS